MVKTTLNINGMACGMCEAHINDVIRREFKVKSVKSSFKKKTSEIISAELLDEQKLKTVIANTGYELTDIKTEEYVKKGIFGKK